jgi:hypothetical protein
MKERFKKGFRQPGLELYQPIGVYQWFRSVYRMVSKESSTAEMAIRE